MNDDSRNVAMLDVVRLEGDNAALLRLVEQLQQDLDRERHAHNRTRDENKRLAVANKELRDRCAHLTRWAVRQDEIDQRRIAAGCVSAVDEERTTDLHGGGR